MIEKIIEKLRINGRHYMLETKCNELKSQSKERDKLYGVISGGTEWLQLDHSVNSTYKFIYGYIWCLYDAEFITKDEHVKAVVELNNMAYPPLESER